MAPRFAARREQPTDDLIGRIAVARIDDRSITEDEALALCTQLCLAGLDTVASFLGFMMAFLADHPAHRREITDDPSLIPSAIDEFLRRYPLVSLTRTVASDYLFHGVDLKTDDMIVIPTILHGLDGDEHHDPLTVDFNRGSEQNSTFGNGVHRCAGIFLARAELRITLEEWLKRIPDFKIDPEKEVIIKGGLVGQVAALPLCWPPA